MIKFVLNFSDLIYQVSLAEMCNFLAILVFLLNTGKFVWSLDIIRDGLLKNGSCLLFGHQFRRNTSLPLEELLNDQVMILSRVKDRYDPNEIKYLVAQWSNEHLTYMRDNVLDFHVFMGETIKQATCIVLALDNTNVTLALLKKASKYILPFRQRVIWILNFNNIHGFSNELQSDAIVALTESNSLMRYCKGQKQALLTHSRDMWNELECGNNAAIPHIFNVVIPGYDF